MTLAAWNVVRRPLIRYFRPAFLYNHNLFASSSGTLVENCQVNDLLPNHESRRYELRNARTPKQKRKATSNSTEMARTMQPFHTLSPNERVQRAEQLGHEILQNYGITDATINFWSYSENIVLKVDSPKPIKSPSGNLGYNTFALRIRDLAYPESLIEATTQWMGALRRDTDVVVPEPIPACDGRMIVRATIPGTEESRNCVLFEWLEGEFHTEDLKPEHLRLVGEMTAKLHNHAASFARTRQLDLSPNEWRRTFEPLIAGKRLTPAWSDHTGAFFSAAEIRIIAQVAERIVRTIDTYDTDKDHGLIHSDLHQWNYMFHNGEVRVIDFDDSCFDYQVRDIAITFWYLTDLDDYHHGFRPMRDAYFDGYQRERATPSRFDDQVETFLVERQLAIMNWVLGWPRSDHVYAGDQFLNNSLKVFRRYLERSRE